MLVFFPFFPQQQFNRQFSFRVEVLNIENYIRERFKKEGGKLTTTGNMGQYIFCFSFCVFAHFSKFSMYAWGKKGKMLVFTGVYVCVKAKLTLVSFFPCFIAPFPYGTLFAILSIFSFVLRFLLYGTVIACRFFRLINFLNLSS